MAPRGHSFFDGMNIPGPQHTIHHAVLRPDSGEGTDFIRHGSIENPAFLSLPEKLAAISEAGFQAIELGFPDLVTFASHHLSKPVSPDSYDDLVQASHQVRRLCSAHNLTILMLQPFANFEGWPAESPQRADAFARARGWIRVMEAVGTDMLQVGSTDSPSSGITSDWDALAADLLAVKGFRMCYENWCWATYAPGWREVWRMVRSVDRANVGLCLDTFQSVGGEWADPGTESGGIEGLGEGGLEASWGNGLRELARTVPGEKIFLLQILDGYRPETDLVGEARAAGMRVRGQWSSAYRPMPYDGGYLPIGGFTKAVLETGFRGWFSMEVFGEGPDGKGREKDAKKYLAAARKSIDQLLEKSEKLTL